MEKEEEEEEKEFPIVPEMDEVEASLISVLLFGEENEKEVIDDFGKGVVEEVDSVFANNDRAREIYSYLYEPEKIERKSEKKLEEIKKEEELEASMELIAHLVQEDYDSRRSFSFNTPKVPGNCRRSN